MIDSFVTAVALLLEVKLSDVHSFRPLSATYFH